jgi:iron complex transport system permease protein
MSRSRTSFVILLFAWIAVLLVAPAVGPQEISWTEIWSPQTASGTILWQLRLPRVLLGLLAGGALAVGGASFQTLFRNPLAEPYTLGVASGAALGAVLAQQLGEAVSPGFPLVSASSFVGAILASAFIVSLAARGYGLRTSTLLLAGIAVSFTCSALILFVQYWADFSGTFRMVRWMMGGLSVVGYREVAWVAPWTLAGTVVLVLLRWDFNQLLTGEEIAASRGVDLVRLRLVVVATISAMVGSLVAVTGPIGFVGLVVPHLLRRWGGYDHLFLIPGSFLAGGAFLALCDLLARRLFAPAELPVGVLTALLGGPFFLWLLLARRRIEPV